MSIADRNEIEALKKRVEDLERLVHELVAELTAKRETLHLKARKRG